MNKLALVFLIVTCSCSDKIYVVKGDFTTAPVPPSPDYSNMLHWAALPDKRDAADSIPRNIKIKNLQSTAKVDVFFIHPTIFTGQPNNAYRWNADLNDEKLNQQIQTTTILNQASVFNGSCRVYAPHYRQAHLYAFYTNNQDEAKKALDLAYGDVKAAFLFYLQYFNQGRPLVIASHSQGSYHAERLLKEFFDGQELQKKLVVAYLIGRGIKPDAFATIHPTERPDDIGVWASWNTFAQNHYPENYERYFKQALSTNPLTWNSGNAFVSKELNRGGVGPGFKYLPHLADAQNHEGLLWINKPYVNGRAFIHTKRWHYADINLFYMNIRENVALRIDQYFEFNNPSDKTER